jgi:TonB family protein
MSAALSMPAVSFRDGVFAWSVTPEDQARFRRIQAIILALLAILCLMVLFVPVPKERPKDKTLPPRVVKMMLDREAVPTPPPPKPETLAAKKDTPEKQADKPDAKPKDDPKPERANREPLPRAKAPEARNPIEGRPPGEVEGARRKAAGVGLLAMKDTLAEIRGAPAAPQLRQDIKPGPGVGAGVGVGVGAGTQQGLPDRSMITSNATGGSGGINTAGYSRDTGGGGLAGRATTLVEGVAGGGGGGGPGGGGALNGRGNGKGAGGGGGGAGGTVQRAASGKASRSLEDVRLVFERNKGAIYAIYNRALREDPTLQGKVVVELKIAASGEVTGCRVVSSELGNNDLERKLVARIKQFDFGAKDVNDMTITYPLDLLPS